MISIRVKLLFIFLVANFLCYAQDTIVQYEYWFNDDYSSSVLVTLPSPTDNFELSSDISTASLNDGINTFNIRFKSEDGLWSAVTTQYFNKIPEDVPATKISAYEYWFDADFSGRNTTAITPTNDLIFLSNISTSTLNDGIHTFNIRVKDSLGLWSAITTQYFNKIPEDIPATKISAYEYWFDADFSGRNTTAVTPTNDLIFLSDISTSTLNDGIHTFNIRVKDSLGLWSAITTQYFNKIPEDIPATKISAYEYWFDADFSGRNTTAITPTNDLIFLNDISTNALNDGIHTFNIRVKDSLGLWSAITTQYFNKIPEDIPATKISAYEYWFDADFSGRNTTTITPRNDLIFLSDISTNALNDGIHTFNIRVKDSLGLWSAITTQYFNKIPEDIPATKITGYRYWFDYNVSTMQEVILSTPETELSTVLNIPATGLSRGDHYFHIQYRDSLSMWSQVITDSTYKSFPIASFTSSTSEACDSISVTFTNTSNDSDEYLWNFGDGTSSTEENPTHLYESAGTFTVTLTSSDTVSGNDSVLIKSNLVKIYPVYNTRDTVNICSGSNYTFPDGTTQNNITSQVIDTSSFTSVNSCDSIIITTVNVSPVYNLTNTVSVCSGSNYTFPDGSTIHNITSQVIDTSNLTSVNSCDSIIITTVNVNPEFNLTETFEVCSGDNYTFPDGTTQNNITSQVVHVSNLTTINSCDSIITTTVNVNPTYFYKDTLELVSGGNHTFHDKSTQNNITSQIVHSSNLTTIKGCDSIIETTIIVIPLFDTSEIIHICSGESHTFPDGSTINNITSQVIYTSTLMAADLSDSLIQTTIEVYPVYHLIDSITIYSGEYLTFPDGSTLNNITSSLVHTNYLSTIKGCDSTIVSIITVIPVYHYYLTGEVCRGGSYTFIDDSTRHNITSDINYTFTLNLDDRRSIINTKISVNPNYQTSQYVEICRGSNYTFPDGSTQNNITDQLIHTSNLVSSLGCDSIIETTVNLFPIYNLTDTVEICQGENYTFPDGTTRNNITEQLIHTSNLVSSLGCDSIIETTVNLFPIYNLTDTVEICQGGNYTFPDGTVQNNITTQISQVSQLKTTKSCDSIIETIVKVYPTHYLTDTVDICEGGSYTFADRTTQNNITAQITHISILTNIYGCDSIIETTVQVSPIHNSIETAEICPGENYTFPDGTTQNNITSHVNHISALTTMRGCDSIIETIVTINTIDTTIIQNGHILTSIDTKADYQWFDCNTGVLLEGETNQSYTATKGGNYAVILTKCNQSDTSSCYTITFVGLSETTENDKIVLYPNPSEGLILIRGNNISSIEIWDTKGNILQKMQGENINNSINLDTYPRGIYIAKITTSRGIIIKKLVIQ